MKRLLTVLFLLSFFTTYSQEHRWVKPFNKILVGPHIELILEKGDSETVLISNLEVDEEKVNTKVQGNTLMIYLDDARITTKYRKESNNGYDMKTPVYSGTIATVTVTYKYLSKLSLRGEEEHVVKSTLDADRMSIKMYGEGELNIASIKSERLKVKLYGDNHFKIKEGNIRQQKYKSYGGNVVDTRGIESEIAKSSNFGESRFKLQASQLVKFSSLGESTIEYSGVSHIRKGIVIGENEIYRRN